MRKCKRWELLAPWTFDGILLVTVCQLISLKDQLGHIGIHLALGIVFGWQVSLGLAFGFEIRDGELNRIEGFNIFPDLVFRSAGVLAAGFLRPLLLTFIWSLFQ